MLTDTTIKRLNTLGTISKEGKSVNGLFRLMENPTIWKIAYANIYSNKGALTKGVADETLDGFSYERVEELITKLKSGNYKFTPVRRVYIPKKNGKKRPLGIPNANDKLLQEVIRILLSEIYEPIFSEKSHGFRKNHSCHTALAQVQKSWTGTKWMIVLDINGFFDNVNHDILLNILSKKIVDKRFLSLIRDLLEAGYMEQWEFNKTFSGTPQGGICSPILANIYLNELDSYIEGLIKTFNKGTERAINQDYKYLTHRISNLRVKRKKLTSENACPSAIAEIDEQIQSLTMERLNFPYGDQYDENYRRLTYCRYADDFIVGVIGAKEDAKRTASQITQFLKNELALEIANDKFHIVHASKGVRFLGYDVKSYSGNKLAYVESTGTKSLKRTVSERMQLLIPEQKINDFVLSKGYGDYYNYKPASRGHLTHLSDAEIITTYNMEIRGFVNYYALGNSANKKLNKVADLCKRSCAMTLAHKNRTTTQKVIASLKQPDGSWTYKIPDSKKVKEINFYWLKRDFVAKSCREIQIDTIPNTYAITLSRTELIKKLEANTCEYCGSQENVEVHHIHKMKDINRNEELWAVMMKSRNRKTIVLCRNCHHKLHNGTLK